MLLLSLYLAGCNRASSQSMPMPDPPGGSDPAAAERPRQLSAEEGMPPAIALLSAVNVFRVQEGRPPLTASGTLMALAVERAQAMADGRFLGHEDPSGASSSAGQLLESTGFRGSVAELVYAGQGSLEQIAADAVRAWTSTPANREVLLSSDLRIAGAGLQGDGTWWKVALLMAAAEP